MTGLRDFAIRDMTVEDYDDVIDLWERAGLPYRPDGRDARERIVQELTMPTAIFLVACEDESIIGSVLCTQDGRKGWLNRLAVLPEHQHRGVARALIEESERRFAAMGIKLYSCLIQKDNARSQALFSQLGYDLNDDVLYYSKRTDRSY